jgi:hypothetical protein
MNSCKHEWFRVNCTMKCRKNDCNLIVDTDKYISQLEKQNTIMKEILGLFSISDEYWDVLNINNLDDNDTIYGWPVINYRKVKQVLQDEVVK